MKPLTSDMQLKRVEIHGYKSIEHCDLELGAINVLLGVNGAGKSNFISFFKLVKAIFDNKLREFVLQNGRANALLHYGSQFTSQIESRLYFGAYNYEFVLRPTMDENLFIIERCYKIGIPYPLHDGQSVESSANLWKDNNYWAIDKKNNLVLKETALHLTNAINGYQIYHNYDTSENSFLIRSNPINDNLYLRPDGSNLAAFLYLVQQTQPNIISQITQTISLAMPFFGGFILRPNPINPQIIDLEWFENNKDQPLPAYKLSDSMLRFIFLATVLMQPDKYLPNIIIIDEPELGLHPYAINILGSLIRMVSHKTQIILTTHSVELINEFETEDIIIVDRAIDGNNYGKSTFIRLNNYNLTNLLNSYSLGELWAKNLLPIVSNRQTMLENNK